MTLRTAGAGTYRQAEGDGGDNAVEPLLMDTSCPTLLCYGDLQGALHKISSLRRRQPITAGIDGLRNGF